MRRHHGRQLIKDFHYADPGNEKKEQKEEEFRPFDKKDKQNDADYRRDNRIVLRIL